MEEFPSTVPEMPDVQNSAAELMDEIMYAKDDGGKDNNFPKPLHSEALCVFAANSPVTNVLALRLIDKRTYLALNECLIETGKNLTVEEFPEELTNKSPLWRRWFRRLVLPYLCREHRVEGLAKALLRFVRDHTDFRLSMSQEEVEGRIADGWRVNLYLRNAYRDQDRLLRNDSNADSTSDEPDYRENIRHLAVTNFVQKLPTERCFNFLLAWMYFETFVRFVIDWKSMSAQNRRWAVWIFIHEGARYMEKVCQEAGETRIVHSVTAEMRSQAEWPFIQRFAAMNSELLKTRVAHVEELLRTIRVRVSGLEDRRFMDTLRAYNNFQSRDNLVPTQDLSVP